MMFFVLSQAWDKEKIEFLLGIEPQTFEFRAPMLYHRAKETMAHYEVHVFINMTLWTSPTIAVCRTRVIHELSDGYSP